MIAVPRRLLCQAVPGDTQKGEAMMQRKFAIGYGFGLLMLAANGCGDAENVASPGPRGAGAPAPALTTASPVGNPDNPVGIAPIFPGAGGSCSVAAVVPGAAGGPLSQDLLGASVSATTPPPPISGGTMLTTRDGALLVAADPERDQLYFVDIKSGKLLHTRQLLAQDEPGRLVEDAQGRIHVALRGGRSVVTLTREPDSTITRREVCSVPRGLAYDAAHDQLHVACAEGSLVTLSAAPSGGVTRELNVGADARDVIVRGDRVFVSHFRAAALDVLDASGQRMQTVKPATFSREEFKTSALDDKGAPTDDACGPGVSVSQSLVQVESTPSVAWRAIDVPNMGVAMVHERARTDEIQTTPGGYGQGTCGSGIVQTSITVGLDTQQPLSADLDSLALAVDMAADPDGEILAIAAPGNYGAGISQVTVMPVANLMGLLSQGGDFAADAKSAPFQPSPMVAVPTMGGTSTSPCVFGGSALPDPQGQVTAVSFATPYMLAVLERNPAAIDMYDLRTNSLHTHIDLGQASTRDTGHAMFHMRAGAGVACASCHPEGGDDGHTWTFHGIGARRTQTLRGGLLGTEPFHWNGDMSDFNMLMREVFVGRMSGFQPTADQASALIGWLDKQPALRAKAKDPLAAMRGKELFESAAVGCNECHSGAHFTNNQTRNVGTGADLQVPALKSLIFRAPLMHNGCAADLSARFSDETCGGGAAHGHVSQLSSAQLADLTAYLETL